MVGAHINLLRIVLLKFWVCLLFQHQIFMSWWVMGVNCGTSICSQAPVVLETHTFLINFYVLQLSKVEIVLEIQWLKTLGPITTDYSS